MPPARLANDKEVPLASAANDELAEVVWGKLDEDIGVIDETDSTGWTIDGSWDTTVATPDPASTAGLREDPVVVCAIE